MINKFFNPDPDRAQSFKYIQEWHLSDATDPKSSLESRCIRLKYEFESWLLWIVLASTSPTTQSAHVSQLVTNTSYICKPLTREATTDIKIIERGHTKILYLTQETM